MAVGGGKLVAVAASVQCPTSQGSLKGSEAQIPVCGCLPEDCLDKLVELWVVSPSEVGPVVVDFVESGDGPDDLEHPPLYNRLANQ